MPFQNPFIKDGLITFPEGAASSSTWRSGPRSAATVWPTGSWTSPRTRRRRPRPDLGRVQRPQPAVGARLQQVTQPGDRVAILCPQNLEYLIAFFGTLYGGRIAVPLFDPSEPGHVGRLHAVLDDCHPPPS
jgi:fatty acid CoA ligase FadD32